jgi:hypothetical protein
VSERVDIWFVHYNGYDPPELIKGSALVGPKRLKLDPYDSRFGNRVEYNRPGAGGEVFGRGARIEAPAHWFSREAAMERWRARIEDSIERHEASVREWTELRDVKVIDL